ncbi:MAG: undecaprenyldiphospho-muramoylpentapeptide beta-N-acetylglucosaminyltransferase [Candidatus Omnitrophota bacterium]
MSVKILIACGGTGGHIFPAIATAKEIETLSPGAGIAFVMSKKALDKEIFKKYNYSSYALDAAPFPERLGFGNLAFCFKTLAAFFKAIGIIKKTNPDVVVGFGGYSSVALLLAAFATGKKTLIHEQNVIMGKANKLLAWFAGKVAVSFPQTMQANNPRWILTGNPVRACFLNQNRHKALEHFSFKNDATGILVLGGSQGSQALNRIIIKTLKLIEPSKKRQLRLIHICGEADYEFVSGEYAGLGIENRVYSFLKDIQYAYAASDITLSRCGAGTVWEIGVSALASILVPYPYAGNHQLQNALALANSGAAILIQEKHLSAELLKKQIEELLNNPERLQKMKDSAGHTFDPSGASRLAQEILKLG